ncbi:hypothetical protein A2U01_0062119, partial [Trifolium medium]|nr:hypothetical protein [Trifolium medium]
MDKVSGHEGESINSCLDDSVLKNNPSNKEAGEENLPPKG